MWSQKNNRQSNKGSAVVEATCIMPLILMVTALCISMMLAVFQQAKVHSNLMFTYTDVTGSPDARPLLTDKKVYSEQVKSEPVTGYAIRSTERHVVRCSDTDQKLRRWQLLGHMDTK